MKWFSLWKPEFTKAAKEAIFLHKLLTSLNMNTNDPLMILTNSESPLDYIKSNIKYVRLSILIYDVTILNQYMPHLFNDLILSTFVIRQPKGNFAS